MTVKNKELDRINTECSPQELGEAIASLDLPAIPPHKRMAAISERITQVMLNTTRNPDEKSKPAFKEADKAYTAHQRDKARAKSSLII